MINILKYGFDIMNDIGSTFIIVLYMIVFDIITGFLVAGVERKINSSINFNGLIRKLGSIVSIAFVTIIDEYLQMDGTIIKIAIGLLIVYETTSVIENLSKIGINLNFITQYFDESKVNSGKGGKE